MGVCVCEGVLVCTWVRVCVCVHMRIHTLLPDTRSCYQHETLTCSHTYARAHIHQRSNTDNDKMGRLLLLYKIIHLHTDIAVGDASEKQQHDSMCRDKSDVCMLYVGSELHLMVRYNPPFVRSVQP